MLAKIYRPARNAMQSGQANSRNWVLEYVPAEQKVTDPLMGWSGSGDMRRQVRMRFESREAAVAYAQHHGIPFQMAEPKSRQPVIRQNGYGDNFSYARRQAWTH